MKSIIFTLLFIAINISANAQFTITPVKHPGAYDELSYPRVSSGKKKVAAKIDSLLQSTILSNETIVTDPKKLFKNSVYIQQPDSLAQSGYTSMGYEILLNNARVLSIQFNLESMGAYPEGYETYFCFDAQTGNILRENDLFTAEGIKYFRSFLRSERAQRIKEYLSGEIAAAEDSTFARERYDECNSDAGVGNFVIQHQNILFYKEYCFPHAWRPFDIGLNVEVGYAVVKKYLTPRGRKLLKL